MSPERPDVALVRLVRKVLAAYGLVKILQPDLSYVASATASLSARGCRLFFRDTT